MAANTVMSVIARGSRRGRGYIASQVSDDVLQYLWCHLIIEEKQ